MKQPKLIQLLVFHDMLMGLDDDGEIWVGRIEYSPAYNIIWSQGSRP